MPKKKVNSTTKKKIFSTKSDTKQKNIHQKESLNLDKMMNNMNAFIGY